MTGIQSESEVSEELTVIDGTMSAYYDETAKLSHISESKDDVLETDEEED